MDPFTAALLITAVSGGLGLYQQDRAEDAAKRQRNLAEQRADLQRTRDRQQAIEERRRSLEDVSKVRGPQERPGVSVADTLAPSITLGALSGLPVPSPK